MSKPGGKGFLFCLSPASKEGVWGMNTSDNAGQIFVDRRTSLLSHLQYLVAPKSSAMDVAPQIQEIAVLAHSVTQRALVRSSARGNKRNCK